MPRIYIRKTHTEFVNEANHIHHNRYTYPFKYIHSREKLGIRCPIHGIFYQQPYSHLSGTGCKKCDILNRSNQNTLTHEEFIKKASIVHNNKYEYPEQYSHSQTKINITCKFHGNFKQFPFSHLRGHGCPHCRNSFQPQPITKHSGGPGCYTSTFFEQFPAEKQQAGWLYILILTVESNKFIKVGITKREKHRIRNYKKYQYIEILKEQMTIYEAFHTEQQILHSFNHLRITQNSFPGHTECFLYTPELLHSILSFIKEQIFTPIPITHK